MSREQSHLLQATFLISQTLNAMCICCTEGYPFFYCVFRLYRFREKFVVVAVVSLIASTWVAQCSENSLALPRDFMFARYSHFVYVRQKMFGCCCCCFGYTTYCEQFCLFSHIINIIRVANCGSEQFKCTACMIWMWCAPDPIIEN